MQEQEIKKAEVEKLLGGTITDSLFDQALRYAKQKQEYIYKNEKREVVLEHWYLVKLTEEYARNLVFSKFTMDWCQELYNMEKERLKKIGTLENNHIITCLDKKIKENIMV